MQRDEGYLEDILNSSELILEYVAGKSFDELKDSVQLQDSVIRRFQIIGEASGRVSNEGRAKYPDLPWTEMRTMRNFLIHQYNRVDLSIVWDTIENDLTPLIEQLRKILPPEE